MPSSLWRECEVAPLPGEANRRWHFSAPQDEAETPEQRQRTPGRGTDVSAGGSCETRHVSIRSTVKIIHCHTTVPSFVIYFSTLALTGALQWIPPQLHSACSSWGRHSRARSPARPWRGSELWDCCWKLVGICTWQEWEGWSVWVRGHLLQKEKKDFLLKCVRRESCQLWFTAIHRARKRICSGENRTCSALCSIPPKSMGSLWQ